MRLLVDVGNSRVKWAFASAAGVVASGDAPRRPREDLTALLDVACQPAEIRVANVAGPEAGTRFAALLRDRFGVPPVLARSAPSGAGVRNGYADPAQLGVDRWLAICAAFARYRGPVCVVDAGTATTVDIVSGNGDHQGGMILPGMALMESTLLGSTGDLARLLPGSGTASPGSGSPAAAGGRGLVLGRDTASAIRDGALQATASLVRYCAESLDAGGAVAPGTLVVTGGAGPPLAEAVLCLAGSPDGRTVAGCRLEQRPRLVLEGLGLDPPCFRAAS